jgi:hypothetical protein
MPIIRIENPEAFVGMELKNAQRLISEHGYESRVVWLEGRTIVPDYMMGSKVDYDPLRVNLYVKSAKVTKATIS